MKLAIVGSRAFNNYRLMADKLSYWEEINYCLITEVVSGGARGADSMGEMFARASNIPCKIFPAEWDKFGKSAGYKRNIDIVNYCDEVIAFWDGKSKGTKHTIDIATKAGKKVTVINV